MDFALLPPEINSARMYTGPGSGPLLAAATGWDALAYDLQSVAGSYDAVIAELTAGPWLGPSSAAMAAAAHPYVAWARSTATLAEQTANQAKAAAAAYELAFAETVPPPVVAANRSLLAALVATNLLGQNTAAIATTETQYAEMWALDTGAMLGYARASASATTLTPFTSPTSSTQSDGVADQAAVVEQTVGTSAANAQGSLLTLQQTLAAVPNTLSSLATPAASPAAALSPLDVLDILGNLSALSVDPASLGVDGVFSSVSLPYDVVGALTGFHTDDLVSGWGGIEAWPGTAAVPPKPFPAITHLAGGSTASAGMGEANTIGKLSVPTGWAEAAPAIRPLAVTLPAVTAAAADVSTGSAGSVFSQMALAGMAGRAMAGTTGTGGQRLRERVGTPTRKPTEARETTESRETADTPPPAAESQLRPMGGPITAIAAELRELASLRDAGILTDAEFTEQKRRLLPH